MHNNVELRKAIATIDWEFANADTQYLTHNIHRYSGKFIPQIAKTAIELLTGTGELVLDPYVGSGTTLLEAQLLDRNAIGVDINPLAILISTVKNMRVRQEDVLEIEDTLLSRVDALVYDGQLSLFQPFNDMGTHAFNNTWRLSDSWNLKWYRPDVLRQLVAIFDRIDLLKSESARQVALVAFSNILRKSSNASGKYPNVMFDKTITQKPLPARAFRESLLFILARLADSSGALRNSHSNVEILCCSNLNMQIASSSIDAIVTHPPYVAAIPYAEYGSLSLNWLGYDCKALDSDLTGGRRHSRQVVSRFCNDYRLFFEECFRVLKDDHYVFLMVGNPTSHGETVPLDRITAEYARDAGFVCIDTVTRKGQDRRGNKMGEEYLIFLQKP